MSGRGRSGLAGDECARPPVDGPDDGYEDPLMDALDKAWQAKRDVLRQDLADDAADYARSEEDEWFYNDDDWHWNGSSACGRVYSAACCCPVQCSAEIMTVVAKFMTNPPVTHCRKTLSSPEPFEHMP